MSHVINVSAGYAFSFSSNQSTDEFVNWYYDRLSSLSGSLISTQSLSPYDYHLFSPRLRASICYINWIVIYVILNFFFQ